MEASAMNNVNGSGNGCVETLDWERFLMGVVEDIKREQSPQSLLNIRSKYYELLIRLIPASVIMKEICKRLVLSINNSALQMKTIQLAAEYEQKMRQGGKEIIFLEAFTARFMSEYKKLN
jgi:replication factor C subunit 3/5